MQLELIGPLALEEGAHGRLIRQVELGVRAVEEPIGRVARGQQLAHDGRADHAAVAGHEDGGRYVHPQIVPQTAGHTSACETAKVVDTPRRGWIITSLTACA